MLTSKTVRGHLDEVKRHLNITWHDAKTDKEVIDIMYNAEVALNHKLGATIDYFTPGQENMLYKDYCLYAWNKCLNEFDAAYRAEILQVRHKYEVAASKAAGE